jgi:putative ABC transport system substrate-binding protein
MFRELLFAYCQWTVVSRLRVNRRKLMRESILFWLLTSVLTTVMLAEAQQPKKVPRVGYLSASSAAEASSRTAAFREGMRELGYVDGKNIILEFRYA